MIMWSFPLAVNLYVIADRCEDSKTSTGIKNKKCESNKH